VKKEEIKNKLQDFVMYFNAANVPGVKVELFKNDKGYYTNLALKMAKFLKKQPASVAYSIISFIGETHNNNVLITGAGFIEFHGLED